MVKQMTAEEILEAIQNMKNEERWKLLDRMYDFYYNIRPTIEEEQVHEDEDDY